jgi:hypothetical protein
VVSGVSVKVLVAHQPAYAPWPGYFSRLLDGSDLVLLDHVAFSKGGWQNRNYIAGAKGGRLRLTVPVRAPHGQPIRAVQVADPGFASRHWRTLRDTYGRAPYWPDWEPLLAPLYARTWKSLASLNEELTRLMLDGVGIRAAVLRSSEIRPAGAKTEMLADLAIRTGAGVLRVGEGAHSYLDTGLLAARGIRVEVATYRYPEGHEPGGGPLSVLDLLLRHGPQAHRLLQAGAAIRPLTPAEAGP